MSQQSQQVFSGRYEIVRHIARGGMAEVYLAHDVMLDRRVALKVLFPELSTDANFVQRFRREAQAAANLSHPNIVSIYDWGEEDGTYFIVMEYVDGDTLGQVIRREAPLKADRAAEIGADVAAALAFAHRGGVVHRDVKPGNVLLNPSGQVKVTDFGIARAVNSDQDLTQTGAVMGTATYFSPEQAQGHRVDPRSDVYSLGVVLFEMVVGRAPFTGDNPMAIAYKHVREQPTPPRTANPDVPEAFDAIVLQAMAKNPNDRYTSAEELRQDLLRFRQGRIVMANPTVAVPVLDDATVTAAAVRREPLDSTRVASSVSSAPTPPPAKRGVGPFILLLLAMLAVLAGLLYLFGKSAGLFGSDTPTRVAMPFVIGQTAAEATSRLGALDLKVQQRVEPTDQQPAGKVFAQDPLEGQQVDKGAAVTIRVAAEAPKVKVLNVVGKDVSNARDVAEALGLKIQETPEADGTAPANQVLRQTPAADTEAAVGSVLTVVVSSGKPQKPVLDVVGLEGSVAANKLGVAGFVTKVVREPSATVDADKVIRTEPAPPVSLVEGGTVTIVVSSGVEQVIVPSVVGRTAGEARMAIEGAGLVYREGSTQTVPAAEDAKVASQTPAARTRVDKGAEVTVRIGKAAAVTTTAPPVTTTAPASTSTTAATTTTTTKK